jgi:hypothetical protein
MRSSRRLREEQNRCLGRKRLKVADRSYLDEGVQLLELAWIAQRLFAKQEPREALLAQFYTVELRMGERRSVRHLPPTV